MRLVEVLAGLGFGWAMAPFWLGLPIRCRMTGRLNVRWIGQ